MYQLIKHNPNQVPWNKGKLVGQKLPLKLQEIWAIRIRLQVNDRHRAWRFSIWQLIASSALATYSGYESLTFLMVGESAHER